MEEKKKRYSRKDLANLDTLETWAVAKDTYAKLFRYMKPYRWRFFLGVFFEILSGLSNALIIYGFKIIFSVVLPSDKNGHGAADSLKIGFGTHKWDIMGMFPKEWTTNHESVAPVIIACALVPILFLLRGTLDYVANYLMMWVGNRVLYDLRNDTYKALLNQSLSYYAREKVGNLVQTVFNQARVAQQNLVTLSQDIVKRPVAIASILATLLLQNWHFTLYSLVVFPLCLWPVMYISKKVRRAGSQEELEAGQMMVHMTECFSGIRVVKANAREDHEQKRFNHANTKMNSLIMRYGKAMEIVGSAVEVVASFGVGVGLYYAWKTGINSTDFMVLVGGLTQIYPHTKALSRMQLMMQKTIVATSTVFATMEETPEVADKEGAVVLPRIQGRIKFDDVTFTYKADKKPRTAVKHISLEMEPGKFYALVGLSGAGKSTLFSLLQRFYDVGSGSITVDGHDVRDVTQKSLRNNIGTVSQDVFLFHDTIYNNIAYGRADATKEEIIEAAKKAHAHEFIMKKGQKYDEVIGDKGQMLSGGQQQRLSIARAILRDAPILLLDEATSNLDPEAEKIIQDGIRVLIEGRTVIAIAHRLSTVLKADAIIVMHDGYVADIGTHSELLQRCELYQRLYQLSFEERPIDPENAVEVGSLVAA